MPVGLITWALSSSLKGAAAASGVSGADSALGDGGGANHACVEVVAGATTILRGVEIGGVTFNSHSDVTMPRPKTSAMRSGRHGGVGRSDKIRVGRIIGFITAL